MASISERSVGTVIRRCVRCGDAEAWEEFRVRFAPTLSAGVRRAARQAGERLPVEDREDFLQDVYCRLLADGGRRLRECRAADEEGARAYFRRIAERVTIDRLRERRAACRGGRQRARLEYRAGLEYLVADPEPTPEQAALSRERWRRLGARWGRAVGSGRKRDLLVFYLVYVEGCSSREAASRIGGGMQPNNVDSIVSRLRVRLRRAGVRLPRRVAVRGRARP